MARERGLREFFRGFRRMPPQTMFRRQRPAQGGVELWGVLAYSSNPQNTAQASQNNNLG
jgi:hypothetical protein